jgi:hypothetical protein
MAKIIRINHVAFAVKNMDEAIQSNDKKSLFDGAV